jgi:hypothetical protein
MSLLDDLLAQLLPAEGRVRVDVEARRCRGIGLARDQPGALVIGVAVALVVHGDDVHQHRVQAVVLQAAEGDTTGREHAPAKDKKRTSQVNYLFAAWLVSLGP